MGFAEIRFPDARPPRPYLYTVSPIAASSSTASSDFFPVSNLIDGNPGTTWVTSAEIPDYYTNRHAPILTFDLGNDLLLSGVQFQNYWNANALKDFALAFATEAEGPNAFGSSIDYFPIFHPLYNNALVQSFSFDQWVGARYVQLLALDNYQGWGYAGGDRVGFAELTFLVVPEPGTLSLLALGGLGLWRRRRR